MFLALLASTIAAMLVLLWSYSLNRRERSLLWTALGFLCGAAANFLLAGRGRLPEWAAIGGAATLLLCAASFIWIAARRFNGKSAPLWVPLFGPAIWLSACFGIPGFFANFDVRVAAMSGLAAIYYFATAYEFTSNNDGLRTRLPLTVVMTAHGFAILLRLPFIFTDGEPGISLSGTDWFGWATLEAVVFIQLTAFLMVTLTKERVEAQLRDAADTDALTGLANRRAFFERAASAISLARRNGSTLAVVVFDLDRFKEINDGHGHPVGDVVLQAFAQAAERRLRTSDVVARLGGEEFAALLPDTDGVHAALVALTVNQAFESAVAGLGRPNLACTSSAGVAYLSPNCPSLEKLLSAADRGLYEAKALGRGQVRLNAAAPRETPARAA